MAADQKRALNPAGGMGIDHRPPSLTERLESERDSLSARLAEVDAVIGKLKAAPETQELLDAVARLGHLNY